MGDAVSVVVLLSFVVMAAVAAHYAWRAWQRYSHRKEALYQSGRCVCCGFDVRANPRRCPECGADLFAQALDYWRGRFAGR